MLEVVECHTTYPALGASSIIKHLEVMANGSGNRNEELDKRLFGALTNTLIRKRETFKRMKATIYKTVYTLEKYVAIGLRL